MAQQIGRYVNPMLRAIKQLGGSARPAEVYEQVAEGMGLLGSAELDETLKSGGSRFENRVQWVRLYLVHSGFLDRSKRGVWTLTDKGKAVGDLTDADIQLLLSSVQRQTGRDGQASDGSKIEPDDDEPAEATPEESGHKIYLLDTIQKLPPAGFERLCQRLLRESGFEQVTVTGKSRDGGIDGIGVLKVNAFVSFKVLFQCKRWSSPVGSAEVRDFRGAMQGRADKGIILTTGAFTSEAVKEAVRDGVPPIELVDGEKLVVLFEEYELGLTPRTTYDVDPHFFAQFQTPG